MRTFLKSNLLYPSANTEEVRISDCEIRENVERDSHAQAKHLGSEQSVRICGPEIGTGPCEFMLPGECQGSIGTGAVLLRS